VQSKLAKNRSFSSRNNTAHPYLLRALVSCGHCQLACIGRTLAGTHYSYYICSDKFRKEAALGRRHCPSRFAPAGQLDEMVWRDLCEVLSHPAELAQALERAHGGHWLPQELQARRENLRKGRTSLSLQLDRLTDAYLHSTIPLPEYDRRRRELEQRDHALAEQEGQLCAQAERHEEIAGLAISIQDFCARVRSGLANADFAQKRQLIELLVDRVIVKDSEVEIRYVIPTSPGSEHVRFCHLRTDYLRDPELIRTIGLELPVDPIWRAGRLCIGHRGTHDLASHDPAQPQATHQPLDRAAGHRDAFALELLPDLVGPVDL
jgi:site-specific DNA recombinase